MGSERGQNTQGEPRVCHSVQTNGEAKGKRLTRRKYLTRASVWSFHLNK